MYASTKEKGLVSAFPDVCKTPVPPPVNQAPIPYPNLANCPESDDTAQKVYISGQLALVKKSNFSMSNGDNSGVTGGVASGKNMGKVEYLMGSLGVKIEGAYAMRMTATATQNDRNTVGGQLVPSQVKVKILL